MMALASPSSSLRAAGRRAPVAYQRPQVVCAAVVASAAPAPSTSADSSSSAAPAGPSPSRRAALAAALTAALALSSGAAGAAPARAAQASTLCVESETADEAGDCRRAALAKDELSSYGQASARAADAERTAGNVPVAKLDSAYARDTTALGARIAEYVAVPAADARARAPLVKGLRADCQKWASQYARGGSARSQSARSMYVAVDAVMGHLASNGIAPLPGAKLKEVSASLEASAKFLAEGR